MASRLRLERDLKREMIVIKQKGGNKKNTKREEYKQIFPEKGFVFCLENPAFRFCGKMP
jgi:hypothetical protein